MAPRKCRRAWDGKTVSRAAVGPVLPPAMEKRETCPGWKDSGVVTHSPPDRPNCRSELETCRLSFTRPRKTWSPHPTPHTGSLCSGAHGTPCLPSHPHWPAGLKWPFPSQVRPNSFMGQNRFFFDLLDIISHINLKYWLGFFLAHLSSSKVTFPPSVGQQADSSLWLEAPILSSQPLEQMNLQLPLYPFHRFRELSQTLAAH